MSSATKVEPRAGHDLSMGVGNYMMRGLPSRIARLGMSPRQQELSRLWSYFCCKQYDNRSIDWDGYQVMGSLEREAIASANYIPPGMYDASGSSTPLRFRKPKAPVHLVKVIVNRFTGLLFSEKRHPKISIEADDISEDFVNQIAKVGRLWPTMIQARAYGGATGSTCIGFQFLNGRPVFEVHDPIWTHPYFEDRLTLKLKAIEKRYIYPVEVRDEEGEWHQVPVWYRRIIDDKTDTIFEPVPISDGEEPIWKPKKVTIHNFGFCPAVWIQNLPVVGDIDGEPDCMGAYDLIEEIDALNSSADRATIANCDPTLVLSTDAELGEVAKGHNNALRLPSGDGANYLEISGAGITQARELSKERRKEVLEVVQVYLEGEGDVPQTATEVERRFSSMLSKADVLREQYGERGIKPLIEMAVRAAKNLMEPKVINNQIVRHDIKLPPKVIKENDKIRLEPRRIGSGPHEIELRWPRYFEPSLQDTNQAVTAAAGAKTAGLIDDEHATKYISEYFQIDDIGKMINKIKEEAAKAQADLESMAMGNDVE